MSKQIGFNYNVERNIFYGVFVLLLFSLPLFSCAEEDNNAKDVENRQPCIMIVPDIQNYMFTEARFKYPNAIADYYISNRNEIDAVLQVGDLTNNNQLWEYINAYEQFFSRFSEEDQVVYCLGNHDYGKNGSSDKRTSNYPRYMIPPYDFRMEETPFENYVRYITIGGKKHGVMVLEFCTRNEVLEWANQVLENDADIPYIILTHAFLNNYGKLFDYTDENCVNGGSPKRYQMGEDYKNDSKEIYDKLIYKNSNVRLVVCGHCLTPDYINAMSLKNVAGGKVGFVMVNFQHYGEGGNGIVGMLTFYDDHYVIRSFSTVTIDYGDIEICF